MYSDTPATSKFAIKATTNCSNISIKNTNELLISFNLFRDINISHRTSNNEQNTISDLYPSDSGYPLFNITRANMNAILILSILNLSI